MPCIVNWPDSGESADGRPGAVIHVVRLKADLLERSDLGRLGGSAGASAALRSGNWLQRINIRIRRSYTGYVCLLSVVRLWYAFA